MSDNTRIVKPGEAMPAIPMRRDLIKGLVLERQVGAGATARVYLATDAADPTRRYAVKFLSSILSYQEDAMRRWKREAEMLLALNHPHIVKGYSFGIVEERPYLVMEFLAGESLAERLKRLEKLGEEEVMDIARATLLALEEAHRHRIVHRDIKPANIVRLNDGTIKVTDFGLAKDLDDTSLTVPGSIVGTPLYVSPEQAAGGEVTIQSDLYSLGVTLFHLVAGQPPFRELNTSLLLTRKITDDVPDVRTVAPAVSPTLAFLIKRLCQRRLEDRPSTPAEAMGLLERLLAGEMTMEVFVPEAATPPPSPLRPAPVDAIHSEATVLRTVVDDSEVHARPHYLDKGRVLFYEDDLSRELYILMSGSVEVLKAGRTIATISEEGAFIGEMSPLRGAPRSATVVAREDSVLLVVPEDKFHQFFTRHPAVCLLLARTLASRLEATNVQLAQSRERLATVSRHVQEMSALLRQT
jgi:serine/threonine protein kinase